MRSGMLLLLAFVAMPEAARGAGVDFTVPDAYVVEAPPPELRLPPGVIFRRWSATIGGTRHSIVVTSSPFTGNLSHQVDLELAAVKSRHAIEVAREDADPLCGAPSVRIRYAYADQLRFVYRYVAVGGRLLIASYAHGIAAEEDLSSAYWLETLCSGIHQPAGPVGWHIVAPYPANDSAWVAPDRASTVTQTVVPSETGDYGDPAPFRGKATVTAERQQMCGGAPVRRVTATSGDGTIVEFVSGVVRGRSYSNTYSRRAATNADAAALATLTSFCAGTVDPTASAVWSVTVQSIIDVAPGKSTTTVASDGSLAQTDPFGRVTRRTVGGTAFARLAAAMGDGSSLPPCPEPRRIVPLTFAAVYLRYGDVRRSCRWIASSGSNNDPPLVIDPRLSAIIEAVRAL